MAVTMQIWKTKMSKITVPYFLEIPHYFEKQGTSQYANNNRASYLFLHFPSLMLVLSIFFGKQIANCGPLHLGSHGKIDFVNSMFRQKQMGRSKQIEIRRWILQCINRVGVEQAPSASLHQRTMMHVDGNSNCFFSTSLSHVKLHFLFAG